MDLGIPTLLAVAVTNSLLGAVAVISVYRLMETSIPLGAVGGAGFSVVVIVAEWQLGERLFTITVTEMKFLVVAAAIGAVVGIVGTLLAIKPDI